MATATHCTGLQHTAIYCTGAVGEPPLVQHTATLCNTLQHTAMLCNTLQHTATDCNTLQHTSQVLLESHQLRMIAATSAARSICSACLPVMHWNHNPVIVAACCSVLQCAAVCCSVSQRVTVHSIGSMCLLVMRCTGIISPVRRAACCSVLQYVEVCRSVLQRVRLAAHVCVLHTMNQSCM